MIRNKVQAAMTADRIRVSLDRRLLIEPTRVRQKINNKQYQDNES